MLGAIFLTELTPNASGNDLLGYSDYHLLVESLSKGFSLSVYDASGYPQTPAWMSSSRACCLPLLLCIVEGSLICLTYGAICQS